MAAAGEPDAARRQERLKRYDANGDGRLDKTERETMHREAGDRKMARLDKDHDGKISRDEASRGLGRKLLPDFAGADANHDSFVSREELTAAIKLFQQRRREARMRGDQEGGPAMGNPRAQ